MTIISGKIEPLKRLKEELHGHGIYRFKSVGEISAFLKEYDSEKNEIPATAKSALDKEIQRLTEAMAQSIDSLDLRSPVEQIKRASYALFVFLNSDVSLGLKRHHWGNRKIPLRNVVVMTNKA